MDLQQISHFLKLSEELHFWNTSAKMNITQSTLSRQIQSLEEELGLKLFIRNKRNVKLTEAGEFLKNKWTVLLEDIKYIHLFAKKISEGETGMIKIAHPDSISSSLLPELLEKIHARYPGLQVELIQLLYENEQEFLKDYKIDLAFTRDINRMGNITSKKIKSDQLAIIVPDNHAFRTFEDITPEELSKQTFILPAADGSSSYRVLLQQVFDSLGFEPNTLYHSDFGSTIIGLVAKGLGIGLLPHIYAFHETPGIRFIEIPFNADLYVNWRTDDHSPILKNVLSIIDDITMDSSNGHA